MNYDTIQPILLSLLTSIITGGFVLVFVEIGNRKNRECDRHYQVMFPFMHKLSAYFRYLGWSENHIKYPNQLNEYERHFKHLLDTVGIYGHKAIISGGDYSVDHFTAKELHDIAEDINNIWYWHDKMHPCRLTWRPTFNDDFIKKELKELNPMYLSERIDEGLVVKVSEDFYIDCYQQVENETYRHETAIWLYRWHTIFVSFAGLFVLLVLVTMLFIKLPVLLMQIVGVIVIMLLILSLLLLGLDVKQQVGFYNKMYNKFCKKRN